MTNYLNNMRKTYLIGLILWFFLQSALAQQKNVKLISCNFQQATISQFVTDLESKSSFHFYYDPAQFDSLRVTLQINQQPLESILYAAFKNTDYHYAITSAQQVFITKGRQIKTDLAPGFITVAPVNNNQTSTVADYTDDKDKKVPDATTENKLYEIGTRTNTIKAGNATLSGYVRDIKSGEAVIGASIYVANTKTGVATDQFGYFTITLPQKIRRSVQGYKLWRHSAKSNSHQPNHP